MPKRQYRSETEPTTVQIPWHLGAKAREVAATRNISLSELITECLARGCHMAVLLQPGKIPAPKPRPAGNGPQPEGWNVALPES